MIDNFRGSKACLDFIKYIIGNQLKVDLCLRVISYETDNAIDTYLLKIKFKNGNVQVSYCHKK